MTDHPLQDEELRWINGLKCPACHRSALFVGAAGFVTCGSDDCPNPDYAEAIATDREQTLAEVREQIKGAIPEKFGINTRQEDSTDYAYGFDDAIDTLTTNLKEKELL